MEHFEKLSNEHRAAWNELISIQDSKEDLSNKIKRIIHLFDSELLPHFQDEEKNILKSDKMSLELLSEHNRIYDLIGVMKDGRAQKNDVDEFISLLKTHIKKEDVYFSSLNKKRHTNNSILLIGAIVFLGLIVLLILFPSANN